MPRITGVYERSYGNWFDAVTVIPESGVSVSVEYYSGQDWIADPESPISTPKAVFVNNMRVRFTPTGGGAFIGDGRA